MSPRLPALLALFALVFAAVPASAQKPGYTLTATEHFDKKTSTSTSTQTLREKRTGRVVWVQHFPGADYITWSKDRRAFAFETGRLESESFQHPFDIKIVVWRAGGSVQSFFTRPAIHADYVEDMFWSPDKKHLLIRTGSSGESTDDVGNVDCLNIKTHRIVGVQGAARRMQWVGNREVKFWPIYFGHGSVSSRWPYESSKPRLWRLPKGF